MNRLNPEELFKQIAHDIPKELHNHLFVTGSLAAAYHYRERLQGRAVSSGDQHEGCGLSFRGLKPATRLRVRIGQG